MYSLAIMCAKFLMDYGSCSPYEVTFYEGIFALIVNSILLAIFTNMPITDEDGKLDELLRLAKYDGKIYIDNFFATFSNMSIGEVFFRTYCSKTLHFISYYFSAYHRRNWLSIQR